MKTILSLVALFGLAATANSCPVAVQPFGTCGVSAVQSFAVPQVAVQSVPVQTFALQAFAVPQVAVQTFVPASTVTVLNAPVVVQQQVKVRVRQQRVFGRVIQKALPPYGCRSCR